MKINSFARCILILLLSTLVACQVSGNPPVATSTVPVRATETRQAATEPAATASAAPATNAPEPQPGQIAYAHLEAISEGIGPRVAGTAEESKTAQYIILEFERLGYASELRPFTVTIKGRRVSSANVIAVKPGTSFQEIIVGAHYDSVGQGKGADDNASGVGVILEVARRLRDQETPYTIRFVLFGAEELELQGSKSYVSQMSRDEIKNTVAMINLDSVAAGDLAYIYGDQGKKGKIRDWALAYAADHSLALQTQPGENPKYPAGTTGDWSDHAPFKEAGIPYAYLEATNWTLGEKDGYTQVSTEYGVDGEIWHTEYDTLEYINKTFPGRIAARLRVFVTLLEAILTRFDAGQ
jgi:alkaline phosphatase isozyme conversion protein